MAALWSRPVIAPGRCCVRKPVPQATSSVRAGSRRRQSVRSSSCALLVPARPLALREAAGPEPPVVVLRRSRLVVGLHPPNLRVVLEAVPNFSEGRDEAVIDALREALSSPARLLDVHVDADHHRSVFTLVGEPDELVETLLAGIACARERIDLRRHEGAHPRIGAADVVPIVPLKPRRHGAGEGDGARARPPDRRGARPAGVPLRRARARPRARPSSGAAGRRSCSGGSTRASSRPTSARRGSTSARAASSSARGGR